MVINKILNAFDSKVAQACYPEYIINTGQTMTVPLALVKCYLPERRIGHRIKQDHC